MRLGSCIALIGVLVAGLAMPSAGQTPAAGVRFQTLDVFIDSAEPLAAWQFELSADSVDMRVVGVENGASAAWPDAPHFDLDAVQRGTADRIVVADYTLKPESALPVGRTRIATVHVQLSGGDPEYTLKLVAAGGAQGQSIDASIELGAGEGR